MTKATLVGVVRNTIEVSGAAAGEIVDRLMNEIKTQLKREGRFIYPNFGTFLVRSTKARKGMNPRTGEPIKVKAGRTVRLKASPAFRSELSRSRQKRPN